MFIFAIMSKLFAVPITYFISPYKFIQGSSGIAWLIFLGIYYNKKRVAFALESFRAKSHSSRIKWRVFAFISVILPVVFSFIVSSVFR